MLFVFSSSDPASRNVLSFFNGRHEIVPDMLHLDHIWSDGPVVFVSRHASEQKEPCFCVHAPGNFGKADHGGSDRQLGTAPVRLLRAAYMLLKEHAQGIPVYQEATHHGPLLSQPAMFIEIGPGEKEWNDPAMGRVVAMVLQELADVSLEGPSCIGIGGLHYAEKFSKLTIEKGYAFGHICPKYNLQNLDAEMLAQMLKRTEPAPEKIVLDWKGLGQEKLRIVSLLKDMKKEYERT
jgi:D-aminoacyl-tRNA deacylase